MLLVAVLLLFAAVGLLGAAIVTGHVVLAWGSVGISSVVVLALLVLSWRSRRRRRDAAEAGPDDALDDEDYDDAELPSPQPYEPSSSVTAAEHPEGEQAGELGDLKPDDDPEFGEMEPDEEDTDAADLLVVWELVDEVLVVDEHPRYHLARCTWPGDAPTERLPVQEARELGFTPCAQCRPDAALTRRHRAATAKKAAGTPE